MILNAIVISLISALVLFVIWLIVTDNYHYLWEPFKWQMYKLYLKIRFIPYMLGVNTRVYGIVVFKVWAWLLLLTKLITKFYTISSLSRFYFLNIFAEFINYTFIIYTFILDNFLDELIVKDTFLEDRALLWLEWLDILNTWALWFSHFPYVSFKESFDFEHLAKHFFLFTFFYPYTELRFIYFKIIVFLRLVALSRRRKVFI